LKEQLRTRSSVFPPTPQPHALQSDAKGAQKRETKNQSKLVVAVKMSALARVFLNSSFPMMNVLASVQSWRSCENLDNLIY
jgi:hypothetical protein